MAGVQLVTGRRPDHFYRKAKDEGYSARSVYKLKEIDSKYRLFRAGGKVLDLGASPGSWMNFLSEKVGEAGLVVAIDRNPPRGGLPANARFIQGDVFEVSIETLRAHADRYDAVVSDLAPKTTGDRAGDHVRSLDLCRRAFELADGVLKLGGIFVCKMFQGEESRTFLNSLRPRFEMLKTQKPTASRDESREVFVVGTGFRIRPPSSSEAGS